MQKRIGFAVSKNKNFSVQSAITHSQSFRGYHNAPLLLSPQVSLTVAPFLGAPRRWSVSSSTCWGRTWLGTGPKTLPVAIPSELVRPSNESGQGSASQRVRTPVWKRTWNTARWHTSSFISGLLRSDPAEPPVWWLKGPAWLESLWGLQKCCRNQYLRNQAPHSESWRTQVYYASGPRGVNTLSSEPWTKGLQSFYTQTGMIKWVCRVWAITKSRTRVREISSSS